MKKTLGNRTVVRVWAVQPYDRDATDVFVVKMTPNGDKVRTEYLDHDSKWVEYEGWSGQVDIIQPVVSIPMARAIMDDPVKIVKDALSEAMSDLIPEFVVEE